jgi:alkylated DNA nucleotide flippase Atl1
MNEANKAKLIAALATQVEYWEGQVAMYQRMAKAAGAADARLVAELIFHATQQAALARTEVIHMKATLGVTDRFDCVGGCGTWVNGDAGATSCDGCARKGTN